jgi:hypothetical protein
VLGALDEESLTAKNSFAITANMAIDLPVHLIPPEALKLTAYCQSRLRSKEWMNGYPFVVNLGEDTIRFGDKERSQR